MDLPKRSPLTAEPYEELDQLATGIANDLDVPVAMVSLVSIDGQVPAGQAGLAEPWATERWLPLSHSFCQQVVRSRSPLVMQNAHDEPQLADSAAVMDLGVVAYAGIPLRGVAGGVIGAVSAIDHRPRHWTTKELARLAAYAEGCSTVFGWRRSA